MNKVSWKGFIIGGIVDVVLTNVLAIPVMVYAIAGLMPARLPPDRLQATLQLVIQTDPKYHFPLLAIGVACSIFGGYVAARIAKHDEVLNGALSAWLCIAAEIVGLLLPNGIVRRGEALLFLPLSPILGAIGGYFQQRLKMRAAVRTAS
jgi:hypothetical protein